ncbi:MAG: DNA-protecting protein DprA [Bacteroidetes bacterium]|nr:DNA-protecting protein DprA [Bacteroidota bacterium]
MQTDFFYQFALTLVPHIGCIQSKILIQHLGTAENIFKAKKSELEKIEGIGQIRARSIKKFDNFSKVEKEFAFIDKFKIQPLFFTDEKYPKRLLNCYDPPTLLFYKGNADLNCSKIIAVIGTRRNSEYGRQMTEELIKELTPFNVLIVSGLAFGIDAIAHKTSLKNDLSTVGVLAHGLDKLYPPEHTHIAREMILQGGLLTEFHSNIKPDKHNFPVRNRIVAGMADAVIVIETGLKGGSMITAELANGYNKDVFAFPGKTTDQRSIGCNHLIKTNKAALLTDAVQLSESLGWTIRSHPLSGARVLQKELFIELTESELKIVDMLKEKQTMHIDELNIKSNINASAVAAAILNLELQGIISLLPGKMYMLNN